MRFRVGRERGLLRAGRAACLGRFSVGAAIFLRCGKIPAPEAFRRTPARPILAKRIASCNDC